MKISKQILISVLIFFTTAVVLLGFYFLTNKSTSGEPKDIEAFTKCLSDGGVKLYGAYWCPHCQNQKEMFGNSIKNINYIECSTPDGEGQTDVCKQAGITSYPTWEFQGGKRVTGGLTFDKISEYSNCSLN